MPNTESAVCRLIDLAEKLTESEMGRLYRLSEDPRRSR